jgi:hypothetical protein
MHVTNIHRRIIVQPLSAIAALFKTLASDQDLMLATDKWPRMKLDKGLTVGSKGGHGPIRYTVSEYNEGQSIQFQFTKPIGFNGYHRFEINALDNSRTELRHIIDMKTSFLATLQWGLAIRWLHDAFIEDALDKVENHFYAKKKISKWSLWVRILRKILS